LEPHTLSVVLQALGVRYGQDSRKVTVSLLATWPVFRWQIRSPSRKEAVPSLPLAIARAHDFDRLAGLRAVAPPHC
jgi:hypothetical protein